MSLVVGPALIRHAVRFLKKKRKKENKGREGGQTLFFGSG
jgi:hypothetical protein